MGNLGERLRGIKAVFDIGPKINNIVASDENIYHNIWVLRVANQCKMGDVIAMTDFADYFRKRCSKPLQKLFDAYEANPIKENEDRISQHLSRSHEETDKAKAYMLWLVRAALYGNKKAENLIGNLPYYRENAYIPYEMLTGGRQKSISLWASDTLRQVGWIDMIRGQTDCRLIYYKEKGYYDFMYVDEYEPPDEDGFGADWKYADRFYDEFFCSFKKDKEEDFSQELKRLEKIRKEYWSIPVHNAAARKYTRRP